MHIRLSEKLEDDEPLKPLPKPLIGKPEPIHQVEAIPRSEPMRNEFPSRLSASEDHLFQTHERVESSSRSYLKLLGVFVILVAIAAVVLSYLSLPKVGDPVRGPQGLEMAIHNYFVDKEKRNPTNIAIYQCDDYYWARVMVEKRPDIRTDPKYLIDKYKARASSADEVNWTITALPITSPDADVPCSF
jgi:hypothetical protein